jgi:cobyric acid synthase CobQ
MIQGTASDVGKSMITAALCRIFLQDGWLVAPFKSQNMSLNSYVTPDGKEIGRAQGMQADACRIPATTNMNPILLKPTRDMVSQVIVHGRPLREMDACSYREKYLIEAEKIVKKALNELRNEFDLIVIEGAGSPAEINLKDRDIVNMRLAGWADAPVILVADIDRGGVFAAIVGTMDILTPEERDRVHGFVINKFRGDVTLLTPGLEWLEQRTGKPVLGVIPFLPNVMLEDEDLLSLKTSSASGRNSDVPIIDIAVLRLPRISNFTDFDPLLAEEDVHIRYVSTPEQFGFPDAVMLPGSKNTGEDLLFLRENGLEACILRHVDKGGWLAGICGGYQMMGQKLFDPAGVESNHPEIPGLGLIPMETTFAVEKKTERVVGHARGWDDERDIPIEGYEIHMGVSRFTAAVEQPLRVNMQRRGTPQDEVVHLEGVLSGAGKLFGTYIHGILHNDKFRRSWLNGIRLSKGWLPLQGTLLFGERREAEFDRLAEHVRNHLDMNRIYDMMGSKQSTNERS